MSAKRTMQVAQKLYEGVDIGGETVGLITYMRTDAIFMAPEAIHATRAMIEKSYDPRYLPSSPRMFKSKQKNAQEAHEAIRPTDAFRHPKDMAKYLDKDQLRLYELIWKRTIASQMASAEVKQAAVDLADPAKGLELHATGSVITFDGFLCLYREDKDDSNGDETNRQLPPLAEGDSVQLQNTSADQHFTQPPPRYTEASLVKKMEELGIGRPSTYASILSVLQDRNYVRLDKRRFIPEDRGRIVTAFLVNYFEKYVEYGFTAGLENQLDDISAGSLQWRQVLRDFWQDFYGAIDNTKELRVSDVLDTLDAQLSAHFFPTVDEDGQPLEKDPRSCPTCGEGRLSLKLGKFGAFIGCSRYPECRYTRPLTDDQDGNSDVADAGPKVLGTDPETGKEITLRKGPYGMYVQLGEEETLPAEIKLTKAGKPAKRQPKPKVLKPKRTSLPRGVEAANFTLEQAIGLLSLPRDVGAHPETGEMITAGLGRFGPFVKHKDLYASLSKDDNVLTIGLNRAVHLIMEKEQAKKLAAGIEIGRHPEDQEPVTRHDGRWGPYVQHKDVRATLPQDTNPEALTLQDALSLLAEKGKKAGTKASAKGSKTAKGKKAPARAAAKGTKSTSKSASKTASPRTRKSTTPSAE
jgi:DNA topoisomerase-1